MPACGFKKADLKIECVSVLVVNLHSKAGGRHRKVLLCHFLVLRIIPACEQCVRKYIRIIFAVS